jgi:hypothetical protein
VTALAIFFRLPKSKSLLGEAAIFWLGSAADVAIYGHTRLNEKVFKEASAERQVLSANAKNMRFRKFDKIKLSRT